MANDFVAKQLIRGSVSCTDVVTLEMRDDTHVNSHIYQDPEMRDDTQVNSHIYQDPITWEFHNKFVQLADEKRARSDGNYLSALNLLLNYC